MEKTAKSVSEILSGTRNLLADEGRWTKRAFGRDAKGLSLFGPAFRSDAVCWCISGALSKSAEGDVLSPNRLLAEAVIDKIIGDRWISAAGFNDDPSTTHADVLAVLDRAIEIAKAEEAT